MFVGGNAMAGAMHEVIGITGLSNYSADDIIDLPPFDGHPCCQMFPHKSNASIPRTTHNLEDVPLALGNLMASSGKGHPGIVSVDSARIRQMCPEVEEYQVATLNGAVRCACRL